MRRLVHRTLEKLSQNRSKNYILPNKPDNTREFCVEDGCGASGCRATTAERTTAERKLQSQEQRGAGVFSPQTPLRTTTLCQSWVRENPFAHQRGDDGARNFRAVWRKFLGLENRSPSSDTFSFYVLEIEKTDGTEKPAPRSGGNERRWSSDAVFDVAEKLSSELIWTNEV